MFLCQQVLDQLLPVFKANTDHFFVTNRVVSERFFALVFIERRKVHVDRAYVNRFATSLEMAGFGITILHLNDEIKSFLGKKLTIL